MQGVGVRLRRSDLQGLERVGDKRMERKGWGSWEGRMVLCLVGLEREIGRVELITLDGDLGGGGGEMCEVSRDGAS
jgi:hypothetical protein